MNEMLFFEVPGEPVAKGRPRMTRGGHTYTPAKTRNHELKVKRCAMDAVKLSGWQEVKVPAAVQLTMTFFMEMPKSWSMRKRLELYGKPCTKSPDLDNLCKVADGINGAGVWEDDRQVASIVAHKYWHDEPSTWVRIEVMSEGAKS